MERQARYLTKATVVALLIISGSCQSTVPEVTGPIVQEGPSFKLEKGILYLENEKFTGVKYSVDAGSDTSSITPYYEGRKNGIQRKWYPSGQLKEERSFEKGLRVGTHRGWWQNGNKAFEYTMKDDLHEGQGWEWYPTGQLYREFNHKKGQEEGTQKMWWENGNLKANYVAKNGRNYGNTGIKSCESLWDEGTLE